MKRILLVFLMTAALFSCSSDDESQVKSELRATIDGIEYVFTVFDTHKETYTDGGYTWTDVEIDATLENDSTRSIRFVAEQGIVGPDASWYFGYFHNNEEHTKDGDFTFVVTESTNKFIKGNFAGTVINTETGEELLVTNGSFKVNH